MACVAVVGLHRGGTSAIAGVLYHLGVFMGDDLLQASEHNPKGYFESKAFLRLHDRLIGDWRNPRRLGYTWDDQEAYRRLVEQRETDHELWGVKDPRLCFCHGLLQSYTQHTLKTIAVFRDPWDAAKSLYARGGHTMEGAFAISMAYAAALLHLEVPEGQGMWAHFPRCVDEAPAAVAKIAEFIGVEPTQEAVEFLDPELVHWG